VSEQTRDEKRELKSREEKLLKKIMYIVVALALVVLALVPAIGLAQGNNPPPGAIAICHFPPGNPENAQIVGLGTPGHIEGDPGTPAPGHEGDFFIFDQEDINRCLGIADDDDDDDNGHHHRHHGGGGGGGGGGVIGPNFADQTLESGEIETETNISIEGNNNNQCAGLLQFGNTGNVANQQGTLQYFTEGDNEFEGPETSFAPENETGCDQAVQQSSAASSWGDG